MTTCELNGCDNTFEKKHWNQKYCCDDCRIEANNRKNKERLNVLAAGRFTIFHRDKFRCFYCGRTSFEHNAELHVDHVVPESRGGESIASNLVTVCVECNRQKSITMLSTVDAMLAEVNKRNKDARIAPCKTIFMFHK